MGLGTEVAAPNSQVVPISQVVLKTGFTVYILLLSPQTVTVLLSYIGSRFRENWDKDNRKKTIHQYLSVFAILRKKRKEILCLSRILGDVLHTSSFLGRCEGNKGVTGFVRRQEPHAV